MSYRRGYRDNMSEPPKSNVDPKTVAGFGYEWTRFDQRNVSETELRKYFDAYFRVFPWSDLTRDAVGFDLGCGSGRWARFASARVGLLHCIDASVDAVAAAKKTLADRSNCVFHVASVDRIPLPDASMDFGYSLGVLHHVPDTQAGLASCVSKLKPGAPFLVYLYYALENRSAATRVLWRTSNGLRWIISRMPLPARRLATLGIAATVYWPAARSARFIEAFGWNPARFPLSFYRDSSFLTMKTDSFDRFATPLEKRFTAQAIETMMKNAGLKRIRFADAPPYWCAVGFRD